MATEHLKIETTTFDFLCESEQNILFGFWTGKTQCSICKNALIITMRISLGD